MSNNAGFATLVGRPNVGKSSLLNAIVGEKVSIVSHNPQTTRHPIRGIVTQGKSQVVFVDTPGIHKPKTLLGKQLNRQSEQAAEDVDVVVFVLDATAEIGPGDRHVASLIPKNSICVVNKIDRVKKSQLLQILAEASEFEFSEYFPVSAKSGEGISELLSEILQRMPESEFLYPSGDITDTSDDRWVAELLREQLLKFAKQELPHSIECRVTNWEWPVIRVEILVERESQKPIVIGAGGENLKRAGEAVRHQLPSGAYLDLVVKVEPNWQSDPNRLERLGFGGA